VIGENYVPSMFPSVEGCAAFPPTALNYKSISLG